PEADALEAYLARGGSALLLYDLDFPVEPRLAAVLGRAGVRLADGVVVDPLEHYFTDEQMVTVTRYAGHPVTRGVALSFYPGVRPVEVVAAPGITAQPLFSSSAASVVRPLAPGVRGQSAPAARS